ncbi:MAG: hypothetical protein C5B48_02340 [Candidatus Rokuibacteriota bacterium]|nr:MAG: hypothetical protein C5B48_02340 [Candidatus Rokubacteria bacterium]
MRRISNYRPSAGTALAAVALIVAVGGVAFAAIPDSTGTVHGCFQKNSGDLRVVNSQSECRTNESSIDWAQQGPGTGIGVRAYAHVHGDGTLDPAKSRNVAAVVPSSVRPDAYCFKLDFAPANVLATPQTGAFQQGASLEAEDIVPNCPVGFRDAIAFVQGESHDNPFYISFL